MVVVMSGSPLASDYPAPSADKWAARAREDAQKGDERNKQFGQLQSQVLTKAQKERQARKAKRAEEERKFKARQQALRDQQSNDREQRQRNRASALGKVSERHRQWQDEQSEYERRRLAAAGVQGKGAPFAIDPDSMVDLEYDDTLVAAYQESVAGLYQQRAVDEANEEQRQQRQKDMREGKANAQRETALRKKNQEEREARELAYRIKKEMALQTKSEHEVENQRQSYIHDRGLVERKKNDEYDAWLAKDHIRTAAERAHERVDPSKMHEGGLPGHGKPTDFTPGR